MNKKKLYWQIPLLVFLIAGTIFIIRQQRSLPYQKNSGFVFGTTYNVTYQYESDLQEEIEAELKKVDNALSMFNEQSIISRINEGEQFVEKDEEGRMFLDVFHLAQSISDDTEGAFDITVAPLVNAWGFGFKNGIMPTQEEVDSIRQFIGNDLVSYTEDNDGELINKRDPRIMLDCSAIAKGYGTDVVMRLLQKHHIENFMIEVGGEVVTRGINPNRTPWRIGVTKPTDDTLAVANELQTVLNVTDRAMATSGNYRNYYYKNGRKYAHTIDPKTGYPVQHSLLSATVLTDQCAIADAYATAFMVMGIEKAKEILARHPEMMAYFIYSDAEGKLAVWYSPSLEDKINE